MGMCVEKWEVNIFAYILRFVFKSEIGSIVGWVIVGLTGFWNGDNEGFQ